VVTAGLFTTAALGLLAMYLGGTGLALVGALATGVAVGAEVDLLAFLTGRYFPMAAFGRANGLLYAVFLLGGAIGPVLAGRLYDLSSTHALWLITATALLLVAALIGLLHHKAERCKVSILPAET
jgi:MFS family permease